MTRWIVIASIVAVSLLSSVAFASLYMWNDYKRPPISLEDALVRAKKLLGDEAAKRYCVAVVLFGDEGGKGESGAWNLYFAAADGSRKHVYINMQGEGNVEPADGPGDYSKKKKLEPRSDLEDLRRRIEELFRERKVDAEISLKDGVLLVKHRVREYQIHPPLEKAGFAEKTETVTGPQATGIWLRATLSDHPDYTRYNWPESQYWNVNRGSYVTAKPGQVLVVEMRSGDDTVQHLVEALEDLFGERVPGPAGGGFQ